MENEQGYSGGYYLSKKVIALPLEHKGKKYIALEFSFDKHLTDICKSIGAQWGKKLGVWYLENTTDNFYKIMEAFRGEAWVDLKRLKQKQVEQVVSPKFNYEVNLNDETEEELIRFERKMLAKRYSMSTIKTYISILKRFFTYYNEQLSKDLNDEDIINYMNDVILAVGYSEVYQRQLLGSLKLFYFYVHQEKREFEEVPRLRKSKQLPEVLSREEVIELFEACNNIKHEFVLKLIYGCGLRVGDAISMKQKDIDLNRMIVHIKRGKGRKDRSVGFPRSLVSLYERYLKHYKPRDYVLEGQFGGPYTANSINNVIKRCCEVAGIKKHVTAHTLRHSFATHIISNGGNVFMLKEILGHHSTKTTQIYVHLNEQDIHSIENPLDRIMKDAGKNVD